MVLSIESHFALDFEIIAKSLQLVLSTKSQSS